MCAASARRKEALSAGLTPHILPTQYPKDTTNELRADHAEHATQLRPRYIAVQNIKRQKDMLCIRLPCCVPVQTAARNKGRTKHIHGHAVRYSNSASCLRILRDSVRVIHKTNSAHANHL